MKYRSHASKLGTPPPPPYPTDTHRHLRVFVSTHPYLAHTARVSLPNDNIVLHRTLTGSPAVEYMCKRDH